MVISAHRAESGKKTDMTQKPITNAPQMSRFLSPIIPPLPSDDRVTRQRRNHAYGAGSHSQSDAA
jgi:hypothetical protein